MGAFGAFSMLYRMPVYRGQMKAIYSNTPPTGGSRGYGEPEGILLAEQLMDMAAEKLGIDPLELRVKNLKHMGEMGLMCPMETDTYLRVLRQGAEMFGWKEKRSRNKVNGTKRRGIGIGLYQDSSGGQPIEIMDRHCVMSLEEDGSVTVTLNHADGGMNLMGSLRTDRCRGLGSAAGRFSFGALYHQGRPVRHGNGGKLGHVQHGKPLH